MARGNNVSIPSGTGRVLPTMFAERQTILVLNPNNGVLYVKVNAMSDPLTWDWVVPSQSRAYLPGPWLEYGLYYVDQSGAGASGSITVYETDQRFDVPDYAAIGVARLAQQTSMDIVEGTVPANPGAGILRLWADSTDRVHALNPAGVDHLHIDNREPIGGALTGFLPNPLLVAKGITAAAVADGIIGLNSTLIQDGAINATKMQAKTITAGQVADNSLSATILVDGAAAAINWFAAAGGNSTTSTTGVMIAGTTIGLTTIGGQVFVIFSIPLYNTVAGAGNYIFLRVDNGAWNGVAFHNTKGAAQTDMVAGVYSFSALAAGAHTFDMGWQTSTGTLTQNAAVLTTMLVYERRR